MLLSNRFVGIDGKSGLATSLGNLQPAKIWAQLDRTVDDGRPKTGSLRLSANAEQNCTTEDNNWNEQDNPDRFAVYFLR